MEINVLVSQLRQLIQDARNQALRSVHSVQVQTCWEIGHAMVLAYLPNYQSS